jgi:hypothetical protein
VQAGLEITQEVARLSEQAERRFGIEIAVRIEVHRGLAYLDTAQDDVYGLAANLAARISGLAPGPPADRGGRTRGRDGKVVPIGIAQEKTPVWRGAGKPKARARGASAHGMGPADGLRQPLLLLPVGSRLGWGVLKDQRLETFLRSG